MLYAANMKDRVWGGESASAIQAEPANGLSPPSGAKCQSLRFQARASYNPDSLIHNAGVGNDPKAGLCANFWGAAAANAKEGG